MTHENQVELEALRRRAYGPNSDIHLDSSALARLRELEGASRRSREPESPTEHDSTPSTEVAPVAEHPEVPVMVEETGPSWARELFTRLLHVRRSTALIVLGSVVLIVLGLVAVTVIQRVQEDPRQVGAEQVARLSIDSSYEIPAFYAAVVQEGTVEAFQEFYGMRAVMTTGGGIALFNGGSGSCINIFSSADMKEDSNSFSGLLMGGCAAGGFPAMTQFDAGAQNVPEELRAAFPDTAAFQFVLDEDNRELVVFVTE